MRRFSQKNHLVTLNEINITPLLDLAFVLLIIFVITTPTLEQSLPMNLPAGGAEKTKVRKDQVRTVEVNPDGGYVVKGRKLSLGELEQLLKSEFQRDSGLGVYVRAGDNQPFGRVADAIDVCRKLGIKNIDFAMAPTKR